MIRYVVLMTLVLTCLAPGMSARGQQMRPDTDRIHFWYGPEQYFGQTGRTQRWINVLGNIAQPEEVSSASFSLNGGEVLPLTLGSDLHRLALPGDFNIELAWEAVQTGHNRLVVEAVLHSGRRIETAVTLIVAEPRFWPLPYAVDFSQVKNLQQVVQVVDGHWQQTPDGVRTVQRYYDRVLSVGDTTWRDVEALVRLTLHDFTPPEKGPPTYDVTHMGVAHRWRGHHTDGRQPSRKWYPLGAQGEFMVKPQPDSCRWRILFGGGKDAPAQAWSQRFQRIIPGSTIRIRSQVQTLPDGRNAYRYKLWPDAAPEPIDWDIEGTEPAATGYPSGALCLVPHNTDVTIHSLSVQPLTAPAGIVAARPGPRALHRSALVGGTMGAQGKLFETEVFLPGDKLKALQVCIGEDPLRLVRGFRFLIVDATGRERTVQIGHESGVWQPWFYLPRAGTLTGMGGASGWLFDSIQFFFDDGTHSPRFGGPGGDTSFDLRLNQQAGKDSGRIRGFYGTMDEAGIETLGLLFDPAD